MLFKNARYLIHSAKKPKKMKIYKFQNLLAVHACFFGSYNPLIRGSEQEWYSCRFLGDDD